MKELLHKLITLLIDDPSTVSIEQDEKNNVVALSVACSSAEMGRLIGKGGHTIRSLRTLLSVKAVSLGKQVIIKILEPAS